MPFIFSKRSFTRKVPITYLRKDIDFRIRTIPTRAFSLCLYYDETCGIIKMQTMDPTFNVNLVF